MSETLSSQDATKKTLEKFSKARQRKPPRPTEADEFRTWLSGLGFLSTPKVHINGMAYTMAVVVVDFGTPLAEPTKLTPEQSADLIGHIRTTTKSLYRDREVNVRVQNDSATGIWWSNIG